MHTPFVLKTIAEQIDSSINLKGANLLIENSTIIDNDVFLAASTDSHVTIRNVVFANTSVSDSSFKLFFSILRIQNLTVHNITTNATATSKENSLFLISSES